MFPTDTLETWSNIVTWSIQLGPEVLSDCRDTRDASQDNRQVTETQKHLSRRNNIVTFSLASVLW